MNKIVTAKYSNFVPWLILCRKMNMTPNQIHLIHPSIIWAVASCLQEPDYINSKIGLPLAIKNLSCHVM